MSKYKYKKLVEDSFILELGHFPKRFLHTTEKTTGSFELIKRQAVVNISYTIIPERNNPFIELRFKKGWKSIKQDIYYDFDSVNFGLVRPYLLCSCGYRANKLYMHLDDKEFTCRGCKNLQYELTTINRKVLGNELFYRANRLLKLSDIENHKYITYDNMLTRRAKSFITMYNKWAIGPREKELIDAEIAQLTGKSQYI